MTCVPYDRRMPQKRRFTSAATRNERKTRTKTRLTSEQIVGFTPVNPKPCTKRRARALTQTGTIEIPATSGRIFEDAWPSLSTWSQTNDGYPIRRSKFGLDSSP